MHHAELIEVQNDRFNEGHAQIKRVAQEFGVPSMELAPIFRRALADGETPYLDYIHLNPLGQELLATALSVAIESYLETR
jgi:lysophospholipase L1-like esterase